MKVAVLDGKHPGPINTLQFNPRYMTFASACTNMVRSNAPHQCLSRAVAAAGQTERSFVISSSLNRRFGSRVLMTHRGTLPKWVLVVKQPFSDAGYLNVFAWLSLPDENLVGLTEKKTFLYFTFLMFYVFTCSIFKCLKGLTKLWQNATYLLLKSVFFPQFRYVTFCYYFYPIC